MSGGPQSLHDWIQYLHAASAAAKANPTDTEASQAVQDAVRRITLLNQAGVEDIQSAYEKDAAPGKLGTALVNFGHGASLGLVGDPEYLRLSKQANPWTAGLADLAGSAALTGVAAPLVGGLSAAGQGAVLGGAYGAGRGAIDPGEGMSRAEGAALGGGVGLVGGALIGKVAGKVTPALRSIGRNAKGIVGRIAGIIPKAAEEDAGPAVERVLSAPKSYTEHASPSMFGDFNKGPAIAPVSPKDIPSARPPRLVGQAAPRGGVRDLETERALADLHGDIPGVHGGVEGTPDVSTLSTAELHQLATMSPTEPTGAPTHNWKPSGTRQTVDAARDAAYARGQAAKAELARRGQ